MELAPVRRHRRARHRFGRRATEAAVALIVGGVVVLVVVPAMLGLDHAVVGDADRGLPAGTLVLTRDVPLDDLARGDLVVDDNGVRRVVVAGPSAVRLDDDVRVAQTEAATVRRAVVVAPYAGRWVVLVVLAVLVAVVVACDVPHRVRRRWRLRARRMPTLAG